MKYGFSKVFTELILVPDAVIPIFQERLLVLLGIYEVGTGLLAGPCTTRNTNRTHWYSLVEEVTGAMLRYFQHSVTHTLQF